MRHPEGGPWQLHMEFQGHEPANAVFLNDHFLGYLPVKDWTYSWVSARLSVPCWFLQPGYNELTVRTNHLPPQFQGHGFTRDEVLFRGVYMEPALPGVPAIKGFGWTRVTQQVAGTQDQQKAVYESLAVGTEWRLASSW